MSLLLGDMLVRYKADITDLTVKTAEAAGDVDGFASGAKVAGMAVAGALIATGVAAVGLGIASTKMAADFQTAMLSNVAHAGLAKSQFDSVSKSVLAMASEVGRSPTQLAEALYPILSAFSGIQNQAAKSSIALDTLKMSFETVAGTTVDGTAVANAAVGTFNALGLATDNVSTNTARMTGLFDVMDKTVQLGNMQWDAYKNVVSKMAVAIQGTSISFNESQAALAELTNEGFSAQKASTYLANTFTSLELKTDSIAKHAKSLGISFDENKFKTMDLAHQVEYLNQVTDGNKTKILALLNNNSIAEKTFNALSIGIGNYKTNLDALNHSQGTLAGSFEEASKGFNFQMQQVKAAGDALMVTIGTKLLPVASQLLSFVAPLIRQFTAWVTNSNSLSSAMGGLSGMIQGVMKYLNSDTFAGVIADFQTFGNQISNIAGPLLGQLGTGLGAVFNGIGPILTGVVIPAIDTVMVGLDNFLLWMQQGSPLAQAVGVALLAIAGGFAAIQIGAFIAAVPAIVGGFIAWSVAAWSAAIATIAATWPIFLIGVAVVLVVALIVLAVKNWGAIAHWLQGVWSGIAGFFVGLWNDIKSVWGGIGQWFQDLFAGAWNGITSTLGTIGGWFVGLWNGIKSGTKAAWDWIVNALKAAGKALLDAILAPFIAIGALFQWLYNHNYYFKALIDSIVSTFKAGIKWIQDAWTHTVNWLVGMWATIQKDAVIAWHNISSFFSGIWQNYIAGPIGSLLNQFIGWFNNLARQTWTLTKAVWQKVSDVFSGIWQNYIAGPLGALWNAITGWFGGVMQGTLHDWQLLWQRVSSIFSGIWNNYIAGPLRSLWTQFSNFFGNLASQAIQWGQNLIKGFIDGINNMAGAAGQAAQNVAGQVGGFLGFHSPSKEGPGKDADKWMPNLIKMLISGLNTGTPQVKAASQNVAQALIYPIRPSAVAVAAASQASQSSSNQQQTFILEVDGHKLAEITNKHTDRTVRLKLGDRGRAVA